MTLATFVSIHRVLRGSWYVGAAIIVMSWAGMVSARTGWIGFGLTFFGAMGPSLLRPFLKVPKDLPMPPSLAEELKKLSELRSNGTLSEEEFQAAKDAVLNRGS